MIIFISRTGNVRNIVERLDESIPTMEIKSGAEVIETPYLLITYTTGMGEVPEPVLSFLRNESNRYHIKGVIGSGNSNWGQNYCGAAMKVSGLMSTPLLMKIELRGTERDIRLIEEHYNNMIGGKN